MYPYGSAIWMTWWPYPDTRSTLFPKIQSMPSLTKALRPRRRSTCIITTIITMWSLRCRGFGIEVIFARNARDIATKKSIYAMSHANFATNTTRTKHKTGSIVPRATVILRTRHVSNFMLKKRTKAIQPVRPTIVASRALPQWREKK